MKASGTSGTASWCSRRHRRDSKACARLLGLVTSATRGEHVFRDVVPVVLCVVAGCGDLGHAVR